MYIMNIWKKLSKPIFILAPMEDVTDTVFRQMLLYTCRPDLFFTEFTNVDGLFSKGAIEVGKRLLFSKKEKPIIAQIWGMKPGNYFKAAQKIKELGFNGIDINMGCPQNDVVRIGACSALMKNHSLAVEIIKATKYGAGNLPVSVKTRIGFNNIQTSEWIGFLLKQDLAAITVHGRTVKEMSKIPAHWDEIGKAIELRDKLKCNTLIIGNGDVYSLTEAKEKVKKYKLDGVMIGRGIFHNPWLFNESFDIKSISVEQRIQLLLNHIKLWRKTWQGSVRYPAKHFPILKKYFKIYLSGFDGAAEIRGKFMATNNIAEVIKLAKSYNTT